MTAPVQVLTTTPPTECGIAEYATELYAGLDVEVLGSDDAWTVGQLRSAAALADRVDGTILHVQHEWLMYGGPVHNALPLTALAANRARGGRNVTTLHTVIPPSAIDASFLDTFGAEAFPPRLVRRVIATLTRLLCGLSDRIIVHTEGARRVLESAFDATGVRVVPHGLAPRDREPVTEPLSFRYVGLINRSKGVDTLLAALDEVAARGYDVDAEIVGRVEEGEFDADPRVTDRYLPPEEYHRQFREADVVVLPYRKGDYHAASGVLADATAHGTGVIVSDIPQLSPAIAHGELGLVVPRDDVEALADAIAYSAENPDDVEAMAERLHATAADRAWPRIRERTRKIYDELG